MTARRVEHFDLKREVVEPRARVVLANRLRKVEEGVDEEPVAARGAQRRKPEQTPFGLALFTRYARACSAAWST